jgi:hypothetical protein
LPARCTACCSGTAGRDNIIIRTVEVDAERAPLVCWAFTEYATGNWTLLGLQQALTEKGLRTRKAAKRAA